MKKALDCVSDYQLKSACKDAICIASSKVTQMIFAVLEDWYHINHHIVLTHVCKLVSFLHMYLLFNCQKSGNEPDACKKRYSRIRIFTFYVLPFTFLRQSSIPPVGYRTLDVSTTAARCCSLYLELRVDCGILRPTSSNCQTVNPHLRQMQGSWWYLLYNPKYSPFCFKFCCHGMVGRSKIQLTAFDGPFPKTPPQMQKISQILYHLHKPSYSQFCNEFRCHGNRGRSGENAIGSIRWPINENLPIGAKISQISLTQAKL